MKKLFLLVSCSVVLAIVVSTADAGQPQWRQLYDNAQNSFRDGRMTQSLSMARDSLKKADTEFGHDSLYALNSLILLGDLTRVAGSYSESARYYKKALDVQQRLFGELHPNTAKLLNSLAAVNLSLGNLPEAKDMFMKSIAINKLSGHNEDPGIAESLIGLSEIQKIANNHDESARNLLTALDILDCYSKYKPSVKITMANARVNLAESLKAQANYREANNQYRAAIKYFETRGISSLNSMIDSLTAMGDCYVSSGKKARALDCYKRALAVAANGHSGDNMTVAQISRRLAGVYRSNGNIPEARRYYRQAVANLEVCSPSGCPLLVDTKKTLSDLSETTRVLGSDSQA